MLCIRYSSTNPLFNLAAEEYILTQFKENVFTLWQNDNALVVGKHQNVYGEINAQFAFENDINIVRRISGGGTVYHDLGNINFSFFRNNKVETKQIDFKAFTTPIMLYLKSLGLDAEYSIRNDLLYKGKKFSGNAEHVNQKLKRTLHHGTILFNSDIPKLVESLILNSNYKDKAIKSVSSKVTNIAEYLDVPMSINDFKKGLFNFYLKHFENAKEYFLSEADIEKINTLVKEKYSTFKWNIGYGPKYTVEVNGFKEKNSQSIFYIEKGKITKVDSTLNIVKNMVGLKHYPSSLLPILKEYDLDAEIWKLF